ncbi:MAG TPA: DUF3667 domain-containing protein [Chryseosolibacter sp.]
MICANCNGLVETTFCPTCGQKKEIHRISVGHVLHEGFHSVTHADKGFLLLVKQLITRPGFIAKEYVEGKRKRYFNPLSFLVISSALLAYFGTITGYMDRLTSSSGRGTRQGHPYWTEVFEIASHNGKWLILLLMAPLFAFLSWIFFIRKPFNYGENLVLHSFIFGEAAIVRLVIFIPLSLLFPQYFFWFNSVAYEILYLAFLTVAYRQFFQQHIAFTIIKAIVIRILFVILFWAVIFGYVVVKHLIV